MDELDVIRQIAIPADAVPAASASRARRALRARIAERPSQGWTSRAPFAARPPHAPFARRLAAVLAPVAACGLALVIALGAVTSKDRERGTGTPAGRPASPATLDRPQGRVRALRPDLPPSPTPSTTAPQGTAPGGAPPAPAPPGAAPAPKPEAAPPARTPSGGGAAPKAPASPPATGSPSQGCAQPAPAPTQTQPTPPASSSCDGAGAPAPQAPSTQTQPPTKKATP
jgi:hypothetical protein